MSKSTQLMGLSLKNPILVAAGPWARDGASLQRCIDAGAAAVITETLTLEAHRNICPRIYLEGQSMLNTKLYSDLQLEQWEAEMEQLQKKDCKLIFSIWASTPSELAYLAARAERLGADALEISISAPVGARNQRLRTRPENCHALIQAAVQAADIPVMVKLSYEAAQYSDYLRAVEDAGANALSAIDAIKGLNGIDLERGQARMPSYGGYTGLPIHPISLATTATLLQCTQMEVCSIGGIFSGEGALEFLMLGAHAVQLASVIQQQGYDAITRIIGEVEPWMDAHGYATVEQLRGVALSSLYTFEDLNPRPLAARLLSPCDGLGCGLCAQGCLYQAVTMGPDGIQIDPDVCSGCGLCVQRCPSERIFLDWK